MTLDVLGVGFGRTGTLSLRTALEILGLKPTLHMVDITDDSGACNMWAESIREGDPSEELLAWISNFRASVDWPGAAIWKGLAGVFPDSKVLLSTRPADDWLRSFDATLRPLWMSVLNSDSIAPERAGYRNLVEAIVDRVFAGSIGDDELLRRVYLRHHHEVLDSLGSDNRVLRFRAGDGWVPLCEFLNLPVPDVGYPKLNDSASFSRLSRGIAEVRPLNSGSRKIDRSL